MPTILPHEQQFRWERNAVAALRPRCDWGETNVENENNSTIGFERVESLPMSWALLRGTGGEGIP